MASRRTVVAPRSQHPVPAQMAAIRPLSITATAADVDVAQDATEIITEEPAEEPAELEEPAGDEVVSLEVVEVPAGPEDVEDTIAPPEDEEDDEPDETVEGEPSPEPAPRDELLDALEPGDVIRDDDSFSIPPMLDLEPAPALDDDIATSMVTSVHLHLMSEHGMPEALHLTYAHAAGIHRRLHKLSEHEHAMDDYRFRSDRAVTHSMRAVQQAHNERFGLTEPDAT